MGEVEEGPYTTIKVTEWNHMQAVITQLRWKLQKVRELLEQKRFEEARMILVKTEDS